MSFDKIDQATKNKIKTSRLSIDLNVDTYAIIRKVCFDEEIKHAEYVRKLIKADLRKRKLLK